VGQSSSKILNLSIFKKFCEGGNIKDHTNTPNLKWKKQGPLTFYTRNMKNKIKQLALDERKKLT
jgi:hypothetical protein